MQVLILGGTIFLGRQVVEALLARGHEVTLFNRGHHNPALFPDVEKLRGDRNGDLSVLMPRSWDAVVDTCAYFPQQVVGAARVLRPRVPVYALVSTVNQYANTRSAGLDENHPGLAPLPFDPPLNAETYGVLKAGCEAALRHLYGSRALILRPGCLIGPHDQAHRFTYWLKRVAAGGPMLVPGRPDQPWQVIDARDVADWLVRMLETGCTGTFNLVGGARPYAAAEIMAALAAGTSGDAQPVWTEPARLQADPRGARWLDLAEWADLPPHRAGLYAISNRRAVAAGLAFRPLTQTARDVLDWLDDRGEREADALDLVTECALLGLLRKGNDSVV